MNKLKEIRENKGLLQKQLAEKSGVSIHTIQKIEQQKVTPNVIKANKLAKALGVSKNGLFE